MKTLVVLHGWRDSSENWKLFSDQISTSISVKVPDLPGFGRQPLISEEWGVPEYANWVEEYIKNSGLNNVILLGHSFGGTIASYIASKRPKWLKGLILYGARSLYRPSIKVKFKIKLYKLFKKIGIPKITSILKRSNPELVAADKAGLGKIFRKVVPFDQTDLLPKINVPTLLIWGENDTVIPLEQGKEIHSLIKGSKLEVIKGCGHNIHLENPPLFYGIIKNAIETNLISRSEPKFSS